MAKTSNISLKNAILASTSGRRFPVVNMVRQNPEVASILSKLHKDRVTPSYNADGNREPTHPDISKLRTQSTNTANNINDSQMAMQMLPDIELAAQILISVILSPKDMTTVEPTFSSTEDITSPELNGKLISFIKEHFEKKFDIKKFLHIALRDMLFETGSYPMLVMPENSVDYAINGYTKFAIESFKDICDHQGNVKHIGLLGPADKTTPTQVKRNIGLGLENFDKSRIRDPYDSTLNISIEGRQFDTSIRVIDNFNVLKIPKINEKARELRDAEVARGMLDFSLESELNDLRLNDRELTGLLFKDRSSRYKPIETVKTDSELNRMMLGDPLIMHLPSEAVIPVFIPGSPEKQIGYFVLLDVDGNPLDLSSEKDTYKELASRMDSSGSFPSAMMKKVRNGMTGFDCTNRDHLNYAANVYGEMIEADLLARLRNGRYTNGVAIANKEEIYRIMLARSLSNRSTQVLWVPKSLMTYIAIRFNGNGIGKSLLDDMKVVNSLRAMVNMANVMAMLKNSIARTGVRIKFDEEDPNPQKTLETIVHEILKSRQQIIPWGTINPADIADWAVRAGLEFIYEGHPGMPDVGIEFEDKQSNVAQPNTELTEELRKQTAMGLGMSPETIDATLQAEFATSVVTNNIMLSKRAMQIQDQFTPLVSDFCRKVIKHTPSLLNDLINTIYDEFDGLKLTPILKKKVIEHGNAKLKMLVCKQVLKDFLDSLELSLPRPDSVSLENQVAAIDTMNKLVDAALDQYINSAMFNEDTGGKMGEKVDTIRAVVKGYFMRKWMMENGILPELADITSSFETGEPNQDIYQSQSKIFKGFVKHFGRFLIDLRKSKDRGNKLLEKLGVEEGGGGYGGGGDYNSGSDDSGGLDDDDFFGTGGSDPLSPSEPSSTETTETSETTETTTTSSMDQTSTPGTGEGQSDSVGL